MFLHRLDLEFEFRQILLQFGDLFSFGLVAAMKVAIASAAVIATGTLAVAVVILAVTGFVRHFILLRGCGPKVPIPFGLRPARSLIPATRARLSMGSRGPARQWL
jgi:hypothetical protein